MREFIQVDAREEYYVPVKPLDTETEVDMEDMLTVGDYRKSVCPCGCR